MQPLRRYCSVIEDDLLRDPPAKAVADEAPVGLALRRQVVHVIKAPDADAATWVGLRLVLQCGLQVAFRPEPLGLVVELEFVAVGIAEEVCRADADIAVPPADAEPGRVYRGHPTLQCILTRSAQPGPANPRGRRTGQFQAVVLVVVPSAQVDRVAAGPVLGGSGNLGKKPQALFGLRGEQLRVGQMGYVVQQRHRRSFQARTGPGPGKTIPSNSLRAVLTTPARRTVGGSVALSTSTSMLRWPAGCSMSMMWSPWVPCSARSAPAAPGSSIAVAALTAPSTPMAVCGRTGMNVLVPIVPPSCGALTRVVFGTDRPATSPRPISLPAAILSESILAASSSSPASSAGDSDPLIPRSVARAITTGMPLSTHVTSIPSMTSVTRPVGSRLPVAGPAVPAKLSRIGAAEPGTPAISVSPA